MNPPPRKHRKSKPDSAKNLVESELQSGGYDRLSNDGGADASGHTDSDTQSFSASGRGRLTSESSDGSRQVRMLLREGPKSAWSDDLQMKTRSSGRSRGHQGDHEPRSSSKHRQQTSFQNGAFSPDSDIENLLANLEQSMAATTATLDSWKTLKHSMESNEKQAKADVEKSKKLVKQAILKYVQMLNDDLSTRSRSMMEEADRCTDELENRIYRMKKIHETYSTLPGTQRGRALSECIAELKAETDLSIPDNPECFHFHVTPKLGRDEQHDVIHKLLGTIVTSSRNAKHSAGEEDDAAGFEETLKSGDPVGKSLSDGLLPVPKLVAMFTCRLKKDKRMCGVTDIALTDDGAVFIADKLNKAIKLYDLRGVFEKCVGVGILKKPSRVSFLPVTREVIVSDDATKSIHAFTTNGEYVSELINMRFPVGHCQTPDGHIAAIEFVNKSVSICNAQGGVVSSFLTHMDCPAYIACTKNGLLIITDWKSNCANVFDVTGKPLKVWNKNLTGEAFQPYGVCADVFGHVMVADRTGRDVICFNEDGEVLRCYEDERHKVGMPFALACCGKDDKGLLAVAEYSGTVRLFHYLSEANNSTNC